jgi:nitrate/TMAO reductase-like tetraheme cytochrome c subunit
VRKVTIFLIAISLLLFLSFLVLAQEKAKEVEKAEKTKHEYVGVKKCKLCHKKDGIHPSWAETKHAKAWEALKPEQQTNKDCVGCHTTGTDAKGVLLTGVQCEACHGPGSDYIKKSIMEDRDLAIANGLMIPDEKTCLKCHNEKVPEEFRSKEKFDFTKMKAKGVHTMIEKAETKEKEG